MLDGSPNSFLSTDNPRICSRIGAANLKEYFGTHSLFCIFSDDSIQWVKQKLPEEQYKLLTPIRKMPIAIEHWMSASAKCWVDPPHISAEEHEQLKMGCFPEIELVMNVLDHIYDKIFLVCFLCNIETVKEYFMIYYANKCQSGVPKENAYKSPASDESGNGKPFPAKRKLTMSELLVMNVSLALCFALVLDKKCGGEYQRKSLSPYLLNLDDGKLHELQDKFFQNSLYYYSRVIVFSEGIVTIQGILMLVIYTEMCCLFPDANYILTTVATRFAQGIGLHRFESFAGDSPQEAYLKRTIWWFCQYLDMEICYRSGKPPMVNNMDVSTLTEKDKDFKNKAEILPISSDKMCPPQDLTDQERCLNKKIGLDAAHSEFLAVTKGFHNYYSYILIKLTWIRSNCYNKLFSASVQNFTVEELSVVLKDFNIDMGNLLYSIDEKLRPRLYNDPLFVYIPYHMIFEIENVGDCGLENYLTIQFSYFQHLMTINRIPFLINSQEKSDISSELIPFRNLALDCARTILIISTKLNIPTIPLSFLHWCQFVPFSAFLILLGHCLNSPLDNTKETLDDINLLCASSMKFFAYRHVTTIMKHNLSHQRDILIDLITRIMLKILLQVKSENSGMDVLKNNPTLNDHLQLYETVFPDLFEGPLPPTGFIFGEFKYKKENDENKFRAPRMPPTYARTESFGAGNNNSSSTSSDSYGYRTKEYPAQGIHNSYNNFSAPQTPGPARTPPNITNLMNATSINSFQNDFFTNLISEYDTDDAFAKMMNNMPNIFFDNNLGR